MAACGHWARAGGCWRRPQPVLSVLDPNSGGLDSLQGSGPDHCHPRPRGWEGTPLHAAPPPGCTGNLRQQFQVQEKEPTQGAGHSYSARAGRGPWALSRGVRLGHSWPTEEPGRPKNESLRNRTTPACGDGHRHRRKRRKRRRRWWGGAAEAPRPRRGWGAASSRASRAGAAGAHLQVGELLLLVRDGLLHQHALDALLHGVLLGLREEVVRGTGGPGLQGGAPSSARRPPSPARDSPGGALSPSGGPLAARASEEAVPASRLCSARSPS